MIEDFIRKFTKQSVDLLELDKKFFFVPDILKEIRIETKPASIGLFLGEMKKGKFSPSLALLDIMAKTSNEKIVVKDIGEMDFLYGKDLRKRHIKNIAGEKKVGFLKLIVNDKNECLGYGKIVKELNSVGVVVKNILDKGDYLRREK